MSWSTDRWEPVPILPPSQVTRAQPARIGGLLYDGKRHVIFAEPESAKTLIVCMLILEFVRATPTNEAERWMHDVAYIDFENGLDAISLMLAELGATAEEVERVHYFEPRTAPTDRDVYKITCELECGLIVIDAGVGAANASGLDDDKRKDIERMAQEWVTPFWESNCSTVVLEHVAKSSDGKWPIGSERKMGSCDTAYFIDLITPVSRGTKGLYKIIARRDRGGYHKRGTVVTEVAVDSDPDTHTITWELREPAAPTSDDGWQPTVLMERVSKLLEEADGGLSRRVIEQLVKGKSNQHKRQAIEELIRLGHAASAGSGPTSRIVFVSAYTSPTSPALAATSPGEASPYLAHLAAPLQGGEARGELNGHVDPDEIERLAALARESEMDA